MTIDCSDNAIIHAKEGILDIYATKQGDKLINGQVKQGRMILCNFTITLGERYHVDEFSSYGDDSGMCMMLVNLFVEEVIKQKGLLYISDN